MNDQGIGVNTETYTWYLIEADIVLNTGNNCFIQLLHRYHSTNDIVILISN